MISPLTQPVSDLPLAASMPVVPFPVVQYPFVPRLHVGPIPDAIPIPDAVLTPDIVPTPEDVLPVSQPPVVETTAATSVMAAETTPPTVLLVDGDAAMRKLLAMLLHREGYAVRQAADSAQALAALSANGIDVVVANLSDDEQPGLIRKWRSVHPDLGIIELSSGTETKLSLNGTSKNNLLTLPLPSRPSKVVQAVQALLDSSRA
jgi:CheY-like chemotaxis protein